MVISRFSEHITIFQTLAIDICNNDKQIKQKMANFFSANFSELSNFFPHPSERSHFGIKNCPY